MERTYVSERVERLHYRLSKLEKKLPQIAPVIIANTIENAISACMEKVVDQLT